MAKENNDIDRNVASVEVVEAIMQKLGTTSSIEELVKLYNMPELPETSGFRINDDELIKRGYAYYRSNRDRKTCTYKSLE